MDYRKVDSPGRRWFSSTFIVKEFYLSVWVGFFLFLSFAWLYAGFFYFSVYRTGEISIFHWNGCRGTDYIFLLRQNSLHICLLFWFIPFSEKFLLPRLISLYICFWDQFFFCFPTILSAQNQNLYFANKLLLSLR